MERTEDVHMNSSRGKIYVYYGDTLMIVPN